MWYPRGIIFMILLLMHQALVGLSARVLQASVPGAGIVNNANIPGMSATLGYPINPFMDKFSSICSPSILGNLTSNPAGSNYYRVGQYPSSPSNWVPFSLPFKNPPIAKLYRRLCRDDSHCTSHYEMDVVEVGINVGCKTSTTKTAAKTIFAAYDGQIPGPSLYTPEGEEVLVRFSNKIAGPESMFGKVDEEPCGQPGRGHGVPISVHGHGEASLAPFDGWAENRICGGESKVVVYPNNRATLAWYHDHSLDITASNAYRGMAGLIPIIKKKGVGVNCGDPWNLDKVPDYHMLIADKLVDDKCQLRMDETGVHADAFYGDINVVSGTPWPVLTVHPRFIRLRSLIGGPTRPYKWALVNSAGKFIMNDIITYNTPTGTTKKARCMAIASDGGYRVSPIGLKEGFIFNAVAERYEVVCDLTDQAGKPVFMINMPDSKRTTGDVPFFCFSHLLVKINVLPACPADCPTKLAANPLKADTSGNLICKEANATVACCPDGTFCSDVGDGLGHCKSKPVSKLPSAWGPGYKQWEPTCWLGGEPEENNVAAGEYNPFPVPAGKIRCGGPRFGARKRIPEMSTIGANEPQACCPAGQFCWHSAEDVTDSSGKLLGQEWWCRPNPAEASATDYVEPVGVCPAAGIPAWASSVAATNNEPEIDKVLTQTDLNAAMKLVATNKPHRTFKFGRTNGLWTINGKTWFTAKIQADTVGQNSWEVWRFETGGGWFHPIHVHLIDFWVIGRGGPISGVETWEQHVGKDAVALHPSGYVYILARFGAHRGDYMFHCHNLRHEDNAMMTAFASIKAEKGLVKNQDLTGTSYLTLNTATSVVYDTYNPSTGTGEGFWDPDGKSEGPYPRQDAYMTPLDSNGKTVPLTIAELQAYVDMDYYRIFYPSPKSYKADSILADRTKNLWMGDRWQDHAYLDELKGISDPLCPVCPAA